MAERLEALKQAAEATDQAAAMGDPAGRPRHLAGSQAAADCDVVPPGSAGRGTMTPLSDDLSLPQSVPPGPSASPLISPAGPPPLSPLSPLTPASPAPPTVEEIFPPAYRVVGRAGQATGATEPAGNDPADTGHEGHEDHQAVSGQGAAADTESPAVAIADMLRHGSSSLFFNRDLGHS